METCKYCGAGQAWAFPDTLKFCCGTDKGVRTIGCYRRENDQLRLSLKAAYECEWRPVAKPMKPDFILCDEVGRLERLDRLEAQVKRLDQETRETNRRIDVLRGVNNEVFRRIESVEQRTAMNEASIFCLEELHKHFKK